MNPAPFEDVPVGTTWYVMKEDGLWQLTKLEDGRLHMKKLGDG